MLRILKCFFTLIIIGLASQIIADDEAWAIDLGNRSRNMVWQDLKSKFEDAQNLNSDIGNERQSLSGLYVFVSTSMSHALLKSYASMANIYGATLVFKGLPYGSFKELAKLVQIITKDNEVAIQIDDEAFDRFNVVCVPTIILSKNSEYHPNQTEQVTYDKMTGNVGIKYSLEQFATNGDLQSEAREYLND